MRNHNLSSQKGSILVLGLVITAILILLGSILLTITLNNYKWVMMNARELKAYWYAYTGINRALYDLRNAYYENDCKIEEKDFADGKYKIVVSSYESTGTHDILMLSTGEFEDERVVVSSRIRLDTVTDYLYFFDGNGLFWANYEYIFVSGSMHANGNICFKQRHEGDPSNPNNRLTQGINVLKPYEVFGPTVSASGLVYIEKNGYGDWRTKIGEGTVSFSGFINNSTQPWMLLNYDQYALDSLNNKIDYCPDPDYPSLTPITTRIPDSISNNSSPDNKWSMTDNTPGGLLRDKYHKGYRINVPTIRKIDPTKEYTPSEYADLSFKTDSEWNKTLYNWYFPYISKDGEKFYIKAHKETDSQGNERIAVDDLKGFQTKMFICDAYRKKWSLGRGGGLTYSLPPKGSWYPDGYETIPGSGTDVNYLTRRRIKNVYGGVNCDSNTIPGTLPVGAFPFRAYYMLNFVQNGGNSTDDKSLVAFDKPPISNGAVAISFPSTLSQPDIITATVFNNTDDVTIQDNIPVAIGTTQNSKLVDYYPKLGGGYPDAVYNALATSTYGEPTVWQRVNIESPIPWTYSIGPIDTTKNYIIDDTPTDIPLTVNGTTAQSGLTEYKHFTSLLPTDTLTVKRGGTTVYIALGGKQTYNSSVSNERVSSVNFTTGTVTFNADQTGQTITATFTRRCVYIPYPPGTKYWYSDIGVVYANNALFQIGVGNGTTKEFDIPQQTASNKIRRVEVNGVTATYIVANYYGKGGPNDGNGIGNYGKITFSSPQSMVQTDWVPRVYVHRSKRIDKPDRNEDGSPINPNTPETWSTEYSVATPTTDNIFARTDAAPPMVQWYNYKIEGNALTFLPMQTSRHVYYTWGFSNWGKYIEGIYKEYPPYTASALRYKYDTTTGAPNSDRYVLVDPCVRAVIIDLDSMSSYPASGVLYSEAPLIIKGKAKAPITIVCLEDVFMQSINNTGVDDDSNCYPVGIITGKGAWFDFSGEFEKDGDHKKSPPTIFEVVLNKVAVYYTRGMYYYGGRGIFNRCKLVGSMCQLANDVHRLEQDFKDDYVDYRTQACAYKPVCKGRNGNELPIAFVYAKSFRGADASKSGIHQPPPHMPVDIRIANFSGNVNPDKADEFIESVKGYIENKEPIPASIYQSFVTELGQ